MLFRGAVEFSPGDAVSRNHLGCALAAAGLLRESQRELSRAAELDPGSADACFNLGNVHGLLGEHDLALSSYARARQLEPQNAVVTAALLFEMQRVCDWSRLDELCAARLADVRAPAEQPTSPFGLISIPSTPQDQLDCAKAFSRLRYPCAPPDSVSPNARSSTRKLKIGYLSGDFHDHATAFLAAGLFEAHDRARFEVLGYSHGPGNDSPMRKRLVRGFDRFADLAALSHTAAAAAIKADKVDVLVDLKGHTEGARPQILALRPAPLQVGYLGFPGTSGADFIDYLVADRFLVRPGEERFYSESLILLPGTYQVNDGERPIGEAPPRGALGLPEGAFVFCCFNLSYKILPPTFAAWMRILAATPGSVLWLLESNRWAAANLRGAARSHGIDGARLIFAPRVAPQAHLDRQRAADLMLDTWPCNAHTTASDALWAGVPLVTLPGDTFASRVAGSLLAAAGLGELIANSIDDYEALAVALATDGARLAAVRGKLAADREKSVLFDTKGFARNLEVAYYRMWQRRIAGHPPAAIHL